MSRGTQLKQALRSNAWEAAERLVSEAPALVDWTDSNDTALVSYAMRDGRWIEAEWLLSHGADVSRAIEGWLASGLKAPCGLEGKLRKQMLEDVQRLGAGPDFLLQASEAHRWDIFIRLLEIDGCAPCDKAALESIWVALVKSFDEKSCEKLDAARPLAALGSNVSSMLALRALEAGQHAAISWLGEHGLDVDGRLPNGRTLLGAAAERGDEHSCAWLISRGASIDLFDSRFNTALYLAVAKGRAKIVEMLVGKGANPELRQGRRGQGDSPLRLAAKTGARLERQMFVPVFEKSVLGAGLEAELASEKKRRRL